MNQMLRAQPGTRPRIPVRQDTPPDDHWCTWAVRTAVWTTPVIAPGTWELKFINAACPEHARLAAA